MKNTLSVTGNPIFQSIHAMDSVNPQYHIISLWYLQNLNTYDDSSMKIQGTKEIPQKNDRISLFFPRYDRTKLDA